MDIDEAIERYFANENVGNWLLNETPVREVTVDALKKSFVYSIGIGENAVGDGPYEMDIEDMLIVCGTPAHFVVGVIWGLGRPHCFSETPMMSDAVPISRRFAVDLSRRDCLEFMEFVIFADKKVVVFLRHFLHTPDYTLPVVAISRLYASYGPGLSLGRVVMKVNLFETANCPNCKRASDSCKCIFKVEKKRPGLQLTTHSWVQYASSFIRKARRGTTRYSLSANIPFVGDTLLVDACFPSLTVVQFGDSEYMRLMQRKAVHNLGVTVVMPRADSRVTAVAVAHDYLAMHNNYVMRKRPRESQSPGITVHSSDAIASPWRQNSSFFGPALDQWEAMPSRSNEATLADLQQIDLESALDLFIPNLVMPADDVCDVGDSPERASDLFSADDEALPTILCDSGTSSSRETKVSFEDVAAIDFAVETTMDKEQQRETAITSLFSRVTHLNKQPNAIQYHDTSPPINTIEMQSASTVTVPSVPRASMRPAYATQNPSPIMPFTQFSSTEKPPMKRAKRPATVTHNSSTGTEDARKHACMQCPSRFKMRGDLQRHVKTVHEGKKSFTCTTCGRTFGHSGHLNRHNESMHLKLRRHECRLCGDKFYQASHLQSHISHVHDRKKPFECHLCFLRLATENGLRNHLRNLHNAAESHHCAVPQCGASFLLATDLARHVAKKHPLSGSRTDTNITAVRTTG